MFFKGIFIAEQGGAQIIGELNGFAGIIATIKEILPQLETQEAQRIIKQISDEDLVKIVEAREHAKAATGNTERLNT